MAIPTGAYAVTYKLWLFDDTSEDPVDVAIEQSFELPPGSSATTLSNLDAAAEASMGAWKASMEAAYPGVTVNANRQYLVRTETDTWPWSA